MVEDLLGARTILRIVVGQVLDESRFLGHVVHDLVAQLILVSQFSIRDSLLVERREIGTQLEQDESESIYVNFLIVPLLVDHLRAQVEWCAHIGRQHGVGRVSLLDLVHKATPLFGLRDLFLVEMLLHFIFTGKTEIAYFDESLAIDENVGWFEITMNNVLIVHMPDAMQQLRKDVEVLLPVDTTLEVV